MEYVSEAKSTSKAAKELLHSVTSLVRRGNLVPFDVGGRLAEIERTGAYRHAGFKAYGEFVASLPGNERRFQYWVKIWGKFVRDLQVPRSLLAKLDWTKARDMVPVVTNKEQLNFMVIKE